MARQGPTSIVDHGRPKQKGHAPHGPLDVQSDRHGGGWTRKRDGQTMVSCGQENRTPPGYESGGFASVQTPDWTAIQAIDVGQPRQGKSGWDGKKRKATPSR